MRSASGPTLEAFVKPDLLAPGGYLLGMMHSQATIANKYPGFSDGKKFFVMSGTSQAVAVFSGAVALLLQAEPGFSPDDVKCRLMHSARSAVAENGLLRYSPFQQGAGLMDIYAASKSDVSGCANQGLDIDADLEGSRHFQGPALIDENGRFALPAPDGSLWNEGSMWNEGSIWYEGSFWNEGSFRNESSFWNEIASGVMGGNSWVDQE
ncbi:S8 family serine peptidase [Thalassomonas actiniarum]|uniref:S8 family serine peptidase n=1 Tax=Thalassomonas actiniarum TaxID=485447 RepID=A0AAF0C1V1_9GAMM|nr:S8 family serine peptidase [Thalassomonas actiniarum]WDD97328.1 S8 family serine peptidase [Thalassomonas actiniarum]